MTRRSTNVSHDVNAIEVGNKLVAGDKHAIQSLILEVFWVHVDALSKSTEVCDVAFAKEMTKYAESKLLKRPSKTVSRQWVKSNARGRGKKRRKRRRCN